MILTYDEYKNLGGGLDNAAFNIFAFEAEKKILSKTFGRKNESEAFKRCIVRVSDILSKADITKDKITSWSNDGVSESIKDVSLADTENSIKKIIFEYLANEVDFEGVPLLYLGGVVYD